MRKCPKCKKLKNIFKSFLRLDGHGFLQEEDICNKCVGVPDNKSHIEKTIKTMSKKKKGKKNKKAKK
jgi:hypothetical protein